MKNVKLQEILSIIGSEDPTTLMCLLVLIDDFKSTDYSFAEGSYKHTLLYSSVEGVLLRSYLAWYLSSSKAQQKCVLEMALRMADVVCPRLKNKCHRTKLLCIRNVGINGLNEEEHSSVVKFLHMLKINTPTDIILTL